MAVLGHNILSTSYDSWNNAFKAAMKKQEYKSLSFEL